MKQTVKIDEKFFRIETGTDNVEISQAVVRHVEGCPQCLIHIHARKRAEK